MSDVTLERTANGLVIHVVNGPTCDVLARKRHLAEALAAAVATNLLHEQTRHEEHLACRVCVSFIEKDKHLTTLSGPCRSCESNLAQAMRMEAAASQLGTKQAMLQEQAAAAQQQLVSERARACEACRGHTNTITDLQRRLSTQDDMEHTRRDELRCAVASSRCCTEKTR